MSDFDKELSDAGTAKADAIIATGRCCAGCVFAEPHQFGGYHRTCVWLRSHPVPWYMINAGSSDSTVLAAGGIDCKGYERR